MKFETKDLLNYEEFETLLSSDSPNERASLICKKLKKYCFIQDKNLYMYDPELVIYKCVKDSIQNELITIVSLYITSSKQVLDKAQNRLLSLERKGEFKRICENATINKILPQLATTLKEEEIRFKGDFYEIHYKNGYINLKTLKFEKRMPNKHFVTNYIGRDYEPSTEKERKEFLRRIKKIYPKEEDLEAILFILGSALTGKATKEQKILFLLGSGSNGKSAILKILQKAIGGYFETLEEEAFSMSNKNPDKTFSNFHNRPHIRIIWNNEPKADQMNVTSFKKFVEGEMKGKLLYENGTHDFNHNALPVFTANLLPNIKMDGGVKRRFRGYNHMSTFTTDKSKVNESKNIYLVDRDLEDNMVNDKLLDSFVDIMAVYANKWINGEQAPFPKSFQEATDEMIDVNDHIQDFIDAKIKFTQSEDDRIGKNEMLALYYKLYPNKNMSVQSLVSLLKAKCVKWEPDKRCQGIKGVFIGVVEKSLCEEDNLNVLDMYGYGKILKPRNNNDNEINNIQKKYVKMKQKYKLKIQKLEEIIKNHGIEIEEEPKEEIEEIEEEPKEEIEEVKEEPKEEIEEPKEEIIEEIKEEIIEEIIEEPKEEIIEEPKEEIKEEPKEEIEEDEKSEEDLIIEKLQNKIDKWIIKEGETEDEDKKIYIRNKITGYVNALKKYEKEDTNEKKIEKQIKQERKVEKSKIKTKRINLEKNNIIEFDADNFELEL
jgi:phage/plasmid-associated DNA primase